MLTRTEENARGLAGLPTAQSDTLIALIAMVQADPRPDKIDVGVGVFRDGEGRTPILKVIKEAEQRLAALRRHNVVTRHGDGSLGWKEQAPFDRIIVTAAAAEVPAALVDQLAVGAFLASHDLEPRAVAHWIGHPGGPAVIDAIEQGLCLPPGTLEASRRGLAKLGNLSSASVLVLLSDALRGEYPAAGQPGVLFAMGPGFCAELVLLQW